MSERVEAAPSALILEHGDALANAARLGPLLDLACGGGRNTLAAARAGLPIIGIDQDAKALARLDRVASEAGLDLSCVRADLETSFGIPIKSRSCGAVLVFRFLYRPLAPAIATLLAPGGLLLYETFTIHQKNLSQGPRNPAFLLESGELTTLFPTLEILAFEELTLSEPWPQSVARLVARRPGPG